MFLFLAGSQYSQVELVRSHGPQRGSPGSHRVFLYTNVTVAQPPIHRGTRSMRLTCLHREHAVNVCAMRDELSSASLFRAVALGLEVEASLAPAALDSCILDRQQQAASTSVAAAAKLQENANVRAAGRMIICRMYRVPVALALRFGRALPRI